MILLLCVLAYKNNVNAQKKTIGTTLKLLKNSPDGQIGDTTIYEGINVLTNKDYYIKEIGAKACFLYSKTKKPISGNCVIWTYTNILDIDVENESVYSMDSGRLIKGYREGTWITKYLHENLLDCITSYHLGMLHGKYAVYDTNGTIFYETSFIKGKGHKKSFYKNHVLASEGGVVNNNPDGIWKHYKEDGELKSEILYNKGRQVQSKTFK